jgi:excisionase family DNA binding protein
MRTHPRGDGGPEHPPASSDYIRFGNFGWELMKRTGRRSADELQRLLEFMRWGEGLPLRVFGELGVSAEDVENFVAELSSGAAAPAVRRPKLYSTEEAAEYLGVHIQTVRAWIRSGKLPASRLAGQKSIRIREPDLEAVLEPIDPNHLDD